MSYTLANAHENGDFTAKECYLCDRVATREVTVNGKKYEVCRTCTAEDIKDCLE